MAAEKPVAATILSVIGGLFVLSEGILLAVAASDLIEALGSLPGGENLGVDPETFFRTLGVIGIILGVLILGAGIGMLVLPSASTTLGILILALSLVSFIAGGGLIIGLILGVVGGILGMRFKPSVAGSYPPGPPQPPPPPP